MDIIFIRHGESYDNIEKRFSRDHITLTQKGIIQIKKTKEQIEQYDFSKVYVSPLTRTLETLSYLELEGIKDNRIREMNLGIFTGLTFDEYKNKYPEETEMWMEDSINYTIPQGESIASTYKRVENFMEELVQKNENSLVVTHEGVIRLACSWVIGSLNHFFRFRAENGSITIISADHKYKYIKKMNQR